MFFEVVLAILLGIVFGIITGLTPGIHINLVSALLLSLSAFFLAFTTPLTLCVFVIAMSVTHTFLDSIPSIFLGAPDDAMALGVLPGHRYLLKGLGLMAVKLTIVGSFGALVLSVLLFPTLIPIVEFGYPLIRNYIGYILVAICFFLILRSKPIIWSLIVFSLSAFLGVIVLDIPNFDNALFPLLSGLFGVSTLLYSLNESESLPEQQISQELNVRNKIAIKALLSGQFSGFLTAVLPGVGASTAAIIAMQITRKLGDHGFMILIGSINTVNFTLSLVTFYVLDKARNGSIIAVKQLIESVDGPTVALFLFVALVTGSLSVFLALIIGKSFSKLVAKVNYKALIISIIAFIILLTFILTGFLGFLILVTATAVGLVPAITKVTRTNAMGCLLVPVIVFFLF